MKNKFVISIGGGLLLFTCLINIAYGYGINLKITTNPAITLQNHSGGYFAPTLNPGVNSNSANIEIFNNVNPLVASTTSGKVSDNFTLTTYSDKNQYEWNDAQGNFYVRSWDGTQRARFSYYGISAPYSASANLNDGAKHYDPYIASFQTTYYADIPNQAPSWDAFSESSIRDDYSSTFKLNLTANWHYTQGTPNTYVAGYVLKFWKDPESKPTGWVPNGTRIIDVGNVTTWSLPSTGDPLNSNQAWTGGTYHFIVVATNEYGPGTESDQRDWTTLAGGAGGPLTVTYSFNKASSSFGINQFSVPMSTPETFTGGLVTGESVSTLGDLINKINKSVGPSAKIVTTAGWWDKDAQLMIGWTSIEATATPVNGAPASPTLEVISRDKVYQMSVTQIVSFELTGNR